MIFSSDSKKPVERTPQKIKFKTKDEPISKAQKHIDSVLYRGAEFLNNNGDGASPAQKEQALHDLHMGLMKNQEKLDFQADLQDTGIRIRKKRVPHNANDF